MVAGALDLIMEQGATFNRTFYWSENPISISSLSDSSKTVTATTEFDHGLATNDYVKIEGANEAIYNGVFQVTVTGATTFTYTISYTTTPTTPATGDSIVMKKLKDITGYSARMQVRTSYNSNSTLLSLTSGAGDITITSLQGKISVTASDSVTEALDFNSAPWDLEIDDGAGDVKRLLEGTVRLHKEVTQ